MRVFIGYEESGVMRRAFRKLGHDAWSCDTQKSRDDSKYHFQDYVDKVLERGCEKWDLYIFHPPCTYLTVSAAWAFKDGPYHQKVKPETLTGNTRREAREQAFNEIRYLMNCGGPFIIENPSPSFISTEIRKPSQVIQPYQFGDNASKSTGLWSEGLPLIKPTNYHPPRMVNGKPRWGNQTDSGQNKITPSADRQRNRSETYPGVAKAIAEQLTDFFK